MLLGLILLVLAAVGYLGFAKRLVLWRFANRLVRSRRPRRLPQAFQRGQYSMGKSLFTEAERSFYGVLVGLELPGVRILAKVRLADIFEVRQQKKAPGGWAILSAISQRHVDFLLVRDGDCCPIMGIELDDGSHQRPDRVERDRFVHAIFSDCGLPLLKVPAKRVYRAAAVRRLIYDTAPLNFPFSGFAETLASALQPSNGHQEFARAR